LRFLRYFLMANYEIRVERGTGANKKVEPVVREDEIYQWFIDKQNASICDYSGKPFDFIRKIVHNVDEYLGFRNGYGNDGKSNIRWTILNGYAVRHSACITYCYLRQATFPSPCSIISLVSCILKALDQPRMRLNDYRCTFRDRVKLGADCFRIMDGDCARRLGETMAKIWIVSQLTKSLIESYLSVTLTDHDLWLEATAHDRVSFELFPNSLSKGSPCLRSASSTLADMILFVLIETPIEPLILWRIYQQEERWTIVKWGTDIALVLRDFGGSSGGTCVCDRVPFYAAL
jgi:hypothetical protein